MENGNDNSKKNILVITKSSWVETNAFGNTLSNFFNDASDFKFSNIFLRKELPQNDICDSYFNITERDLIKYVMKPKKIGSFFSSQDLNHLNQNRKNNEEINKTKRYVDFFRRNRLTVFIFGIEVLWALGGWKNKKLDQFLEDSKVELIFAAAADPIYLQKIVRYCKRKTGAKLILFFADDIYSYKTNSPLKYLYQLTLRRNIRKSVKSASKLYGASTMLCEEYENYFGREIEPLFKSCIFNKEYKKKNPSNPIKMVYAGNLYYGREVILESLVNEISEINKDDLKITLEIYTSSTINDDLYSKLNKGESSKIIGALPYSKIKEILTNSDIVLHVESFENDQISTTRLSFSTKIIDCMQSGSCMLAIGPRGIASIEYLKSIKGPIVVNNVSDIRDSLKNIVADPRIISYKAEELYKFAVKNHSTNINQEKLLNKIKSL